MNYEKLADEKSIIKTVASLEKRKIEVFVFDKKDQVLEKIKELIPAGASVMNGSSVTLEQVGYIDYLKEDKHGWKNLKDAILAEKDPAKQDLLRRQSVASDYYLGSVHALTQDGQMLIASNSGSQLPHIVYTSPNIIFVVGAQKIVPDLPSAFARLNDYVIGLEDKRIMQLYGSHTYPAKELIYNGENPNSARKIKMIIIKEKLGY